VIGRGLLVARIVLAGLVGVAAIAASLWLAPGFDGVAGSVLAAISLAIAVAIGVG